MKIVIANDLKELGSAAGKAAAGSIKQAISQNGTAAIILATGTSQFETLNQLVAEPGIDWRNVVVFHLDEYIGLSESHPASFRNYLQKRFIEKVPTLKAVYLINGEADARQECSRLGKLI